MTQITKIILLLLVMPIILFAQSDKNFTGGQESEIILTILDSEALNLYLRLDQISKDVPIDTLNKMMIERTVLDTLNAMSADIINVGRIVQLDIDFSLRENSSDESVTNRSIDVTIQIAYDSSSDTRKEIDPFIKESKSVVLSTTQQRLTKNFTIEIDNSLTELADLLNNQSKIEFRKVKVAEEVSGSKPGIFQVALNGKHLGYTYKEIKAKAYEKKRLTAIDLPEGIQTIGTRAFANNRLSSINIPHSVTSIEVSAFVNNPLAKVSIGENVQLGKNAIGVGFETFYNKIGKKAGIYVYNKNKRSWEQDTSMTRQK